MSKNNNKKSRSEDSKKLTSHNIPISEFLDKLNSLIDENADKFVKKLRNLVACQSVSSDLTHRDQCIKAADLIKKWITELDGTYKSVDIGFQETSDGNKFPLPPVILASFGDDDAEKPVLVVYGHYDVTEASQEEGWNTDPFKLTEEDGKLYGRGASVSKGPLVSWLSAIECYKMLDIPLPINLKFIIEGMGEVHSECLVDLIKLEKKPKGFLQYVDFVCISELTWNTLEKPSLLASTRGACRVEVEISGVERALNSSLYSGLVREPFLDLVIILADLVDDEGKLLVTFDSDKNKESSANGDRDHDDHDDHDEFEKSTFDLTDLKADTEHVVESENPYEDVTITFHGFGGSITGEGVRPLIPGVVSTKFSIYVPPHINANTVMDAVIKHIEESFESLGSTNKLSISGSTNEGWKGNSSNALFTSAVNAIKLMYNTSPTFVDSPMTQNTANILEKELDCDLVILPLGLIDDRQNCENEKFDRCNLLDSVGLLSLLIDQLSLVTRGSPELARMAATQSGGVFKTMRGLWTGLS